MFKKSMVALTAVAALVASQANAEGWETEVCNGGACTPDVPPQIVVGFLVVSTFQSNIERNFEGARRESSVLNKAIKATSGISIRNIEKYGLAGGPNSEVRKAGRFFAKVFGW